MNRKCSLLQQVLGAVSAFLYSHMGLFLPSVHTRKYQELSALQRAVRGQQQGGQKPLCGFQKHAVHVFIQAWFQGQELASF